ncbi:MAG TPA: AAA family ATPase, partial [Solirubrobacteraceae bacterium]
MTMRGSGLAGSLARTELLEREEELDALRIVIGEAVAGRSRVVVVEGAAGIGKTRLLAAARTLAAEAQLRVLGARGGELEREFAFGIVRQLFESQTAQATGAFDGAAAAARDALDVPDPSTEPDANPSFASLHGLYWLTVNLSAGAPLVIAIDDLQWCDSPSLRFLAYLVHRLEGLSVLVLATLRSSARADSMLIGEIVGDPVTVSIKPKPLSTRAVGRLVRERLGEQADEVFRTACHAATGGNPLLVHELLKTLQIEGVAPDAAHLAAVEHLGPRAVSRAVLMRLARLPDAAVGIARAVAVLGDHAAISDVAALAGTDLEQMNGAVLALVDAEILRAGPALGFVHPLVEAAVHHDIPDVERALAHERAATLLTAGGADAERVAAHVLASPTRGEPRSVETLVSAARSSLRRGGVESAVAYLARALREPPAPARRAELLLELGRAEALTNGPAALEHLGDAYELLDEPRLRVSAALLLGRCLLLTGRAAEGAAVAHQTADELGPEFDDERLALEALELMAIFMAGGDDRALGPRDRRRRDPVGAGIGAKMLAAVTVQEWAVSGGACAACADLALEALAGGELIAADNGLLSVAPIVVLALADRDEALAAWEHSLAEAHRRGSLFARKSVTLWHGFTMYWRGDLVEAQASLRSSDEGLWGMGQTGRR